MFILLSCTQNSTRPVPNDGIDILFLMSNNLGGNNFLIRDVFEYNGWQVTTTAVGDAVKPCVFWGRYEESLPIIPERSLSEIGPVDRYDALVLPTSPGQALKVGNAYDDILQSSHALEIIQTAANNQKAVFAMCSGVRALAAADVIRSKNVVGSPRFQNEYTDAGATYLGNKKNDSRPCISENVITAARGQTYNQSIGYAISSVLESRQPRGLKSLQSTHIQKWNTLYSADFLDWSRSYGGEGADGCRALCESADGGYYLTGYTFPPGSPDADLLVVHTDSDGALIWSATFGGKGSDYGNSCAVVEDGVLVVGYTTSFGNGEKDLYILKLDREGNEVWSNTFGGKKEDVGMSISVSDDGSAYVCGFTQSQSKGEEDVYLIRIDKNGNILWENRYGGTRIDLGTSVSVHPDGGCVFGASSLSYGGQNTDFWLVRVDSGGNELWAKAYGANPKPGHGFDWCCDVQVTQDGGVVAAGYSDTNDLMDAVVIKVDRLGNKEWLQVMGDRPFYQFGYAIRETSEGEYILAGVTKSMRKTARKGETAYNNDIYLVRLSSTGDITWEEELGGSGSDWAVSLSIAADGTIVLAGHTITDGRASDILLAKMVHLMPHLAMQRIRLKPADCIAGVFEKKDAILNKSEKIVVASGVGPNLSTGGYPDHIRPGNKPYLSSR